jgi:hypothetical protein
MTAAPYTRTERPYFSESFIDPAARQKDFACRNNILFIDNRDRDRTNDDKGAYTVNTAPYAFTVNMEDISRGRYENVVSCELKSLIFPKIDEESYVVVDIEEFQDAHDVVNSTNTNMDHVFAIANFDGVDATNPASGMQPGDRKPIRGIDFYKKIVNFNPPLASLHKLTCKFRKYGGNVVTKADVGNVENVSFILEVVTANKNVGRMI